MEGLQVSQAPQGSVACLCAAQSISLSSSPDCSPLRANKCIGPGQLTLLSCPSWKKMFMVPVAACG